MKAARLRTLRITGHSATAPCLGCQFRLFTILARNQQEAQPRTTTSRGKLAPPARQIAPERLRKGFVVKPIGAPIGFASPPNSREDWAKIERSGSTFAERNEATRQVLLKKWNKPYIRDLRNMDINRGKFYLANERLYKKHFSLYFPNLLGTTLASKTGSNTTSVLKGKVSVVSVFSRAWAETQVHTWIGNPKDKQLSGVLEAIGSSGGEAQLVELNHEDNKMLSMFFPFFRYTISKTRAQEQHDKYFLVAGLPQTVKDTLALMNDRIGYVFLLDRDCKIRWSGCADATEPEKESLVKGLKKLIAEQQA